MTLLEGGVFPLALVGVPPELQLNRFGLVLGVTRGRIGPLPLASEDGEEGVAPPACSRSIPAN
jgi:hypothetical protein